MININKILLYLPLSLLISISSSAQAPYFCERHVLPVEWPAASPAELVSGHLNFSSSATNSWASWVIKNNTDSPIVQFASVIEILGPGDQHLLTLVVRDVAPGFISRAPALPSFFPRYETGDFHTAVFPKDKADVVATSPLVLTNCPAAARVLWVQIDFLSGSSFKHQVVNFRLDPQLLQSDLSNVAPPPFKGARDKLLTININQEGKPSLTYIEADPKTASWLEGVIRKLKFTPTNVGGELLQDQIKLLFSLHASRQLDFTAVTKHRGEKMPFVVVDVYPPERYQGKPEIFYAGQPVN